MTESESVVLPLDDGARASRGQRHLLFGLPLLDPKHASPPYIEPASLPGFTRACQALVRELIDDGWYGRHDPKGAWYYGADVSVDPDWRGLGLGRRLYDARKALVRRHGKRGAGATIQSDAVAPMTTILPRPCVLIS